MKGVEVMEGVEEVMNGGGKGDGDEKGGSEKSEGW